MAGHHDGEWVQSSHYGIFWLDLNAGYQLLVCCWILLFIITAIPDSKGSSSTLSENGFWSKGSSALGSSLIHLVVHSMLNFTVSGCSATKNFHFHLFHRCFRCQAMPSGSSKSMSIASPCCSKDRTIVQQLDGSSIELADSNQTPHSDDVERGNVVEGEQETTLPRADGGKNAWLFLAGCFVFEALVWGKLLEPLTLKHPA